jgi:hypothetical protein
LNSIPGQERFQKSTLKMIDFTGIFIRINVYILIVTYYANYKILNWYIGGWSPIGSTRHCGHQWLIVPTPGVYDGEIDGLAGVTEVLKENLPQCRFIHHKPHMLPGCEPEPRRWEASV